jgi:hypothetical protein
MQPTFMHTRPVQFGELPLACIQNDTFVLEKTTMAQGFISISTILLVVCLSG